MLPAPIYAGAPADGSADPDSASVALLVLGSDENPFWRALADAAKASARSLELNLDVHYARDREAVHDRLNALLSDTSPPDGLIYTGPADTALALLEKTEAARVPTLLVNSGVQPSQLDAANDKFAYWLGQIVPPDERVGYEVAQRLIAAVSGQQNGDTSTVNLIALSGGKADTAAIRRNRGLRRAIQEAPHAHLLTLEATDWSSAQAGAKLEAALQAYPEANAVWTASGLMIPAVLPALEQSGRAAGGDVHVATVGWTTPGLEALNQGQLVADVGGHFLEGAWAVVVLHDHLEGHPLPTERWVMHSPVVTVTADNITAYRRAIESRAWEQAGFGRFSLLQNEDDRSYAFDIPLLFGLHE